MVRTNQSPEGGARRSSGSLVTWLRSHVDTDIAGYEVDEGQVTLVRRTTLAEIRLPCPAPHRVDACRVRLHRWCEVPVLFRVVASGALRRCVGRVHVVRQQLRAYASTVVQSRIHRPALPVVLVFQGEVAVGQTPVAPRVASVVHQPARRPPPGMGP